MDSDFSLIKQGEYTIRFANRILVVNIIRMDSTLFLWIGSPLRPSFQNLAVAINTTLGDPAATVLLSSNDFQFE